MYQNRLTVLIHNMTPCFLQLVTKRHEDTFLMMVTCYMQNLNILAMSMLLEYKINKKIPVTRTPVLGVLVTGIFLFILYSSIRAYN